MFNVFNHTNFTTLALAFATPSTFGTVTGVRDPRTMQLGGEVHFLVAARFVVLGRTFCWEIDAGATMLRGDHGG